MWIVFGGKMAPQRAIELYRGAKKLLNKYLAILKAIRFLTQFTSFFKEPNEERPTFGEAISIVFAVNLQNAKANELTAKRRLPA